jgi:hypothetical protein
MWPIKWKLRHKLLAAEMDYIRCSARISWMDRIEMKWLKKNGNEERHVTGNRRMEEQQLRWYG